MSGFVLWEGSSQIDRKPITCICTLGSKNEKTGDMIQTWILRRDINPIEALSKGKDYSICGNCKLRKNICYIAVHQAPNQVYRKYKQNGYPRPINPYELFKNQLVRLGSYGDPVAVPLRIWRNVLNNAAGHTGYSHSWNVKRFQKYQSIVMASVDSEEERTLASSLGWRTFRVKSSDEVVKKKEIICPASIEAGKKTTCAKCLMCNGSGDNRKPKVLKDIVINVHGRIYKQNNFGELLD